MLGQQQATVSTPKLCCFGIYRVAGGGDVVCDPDPAERTAMLADFHSSDRARLHAHLVDVADSLRELRWRGASAHLHRRIGQPSRLPRFSLPRFRPLHLAQDTGCVSTNNGGNGSTSNSNRRDLLLESIPVVFGSGLGLVKMQPWRDWRAAWASRDRVSRRLAAACHDQPTMG
jgi:hypothetical protein